MPLCSHQVLKANLVQRDVCYGLVRSAHTLEHAGYVQTDFVKFVWIYWRPDNIPVARKMQIGVSEGGMKTLFAPYHAELQACTDDELGAGPLAEILDSVTMRYKNSAAVLLRLDTFYTWYYYCWPYVLLRGTIVTRTYGVHKNVYI